MRKKYGIGNKMPKSDDVTILYTTVLAIAVREVEHWQDLPLVVGVIVRVPSDLLAYPHARTSATEAPTNEASR